MVATRVAVIEAAVPNTVADDLGGREATEPVGEETGPLRTPVMVASVTVLVTPCEAMTTNDVPT